MHQWKLSGSGLEAEFEVSGLGMCFITSHHMVSDCSPMFLSLKTHLITAQTLPRVPRYDGLCWVGISGSGALVKSISGVLEKSYG